MYTLHTEHSHFLPLPPITPLHNSLHVCSFCFVTQKLNQGHLRNHEFRAMCWFLGGGLSRGYTPKDNDYISPRIYQ